MARKGCSDEDILRLLHEIELHLASGSDVSTACRKAGVSDANYYNWRKKFGGMGRSQLSEMKSLEKEKQRLKKIVAVRRIADAGRTARRRNIPPTRQIKLNLTQKLQKVFVRMPLPGHHKLPYC